MAIIIIYNSTVTSYCHIPTYRVSWKNMKCNLFKNTILDFQIKTGSKGRPQSLPLQISYNTGKTSNSKNSFKNKKCLQPKPMKTKIILLFQNQYIWNIKKWNMAGNQILNKRERWQSQHIHLVNSFFCSPRWLRLTSSPKSLTSPHSSPQTRVLLINRSCLKKNSSFLHLIYQPLFICTYTLSSFIKDQLSLLLNKARPYLCPHSMFSWKLKGCVLWLFPPFSASSFSLSLLDYFNQ